MKRFEGIKDFAENSEFDTLGEAALHGQVQIILSFKNNSLPIELPLRSQ
jgi:hypothetical protein